MTPISHSHRPATPGRLMILAAGLCLFAGAALAGAPEPPRGFGNIPFGTAKGEALQLNAGNGKLADLPDKTTSFTYDTLIAGMPFQVVQKFDTTGRAVDAMVTYASREANPACIDRFNFVLAKLTKRYGKPTNTPALRREDAGGKRQDSYTLEFAFKNGAAISAAVKSSYAPPQPRGKGGATPAPAGPAGAGGADACDINLHYLPPRWTARF